MVNELPGILRRVAEGAGLEAAINLARIKGGCHAYIPEAGNLTAEHWLVKSVGQQMAIELCREYGGSRIPIPLGPFSGNRAKVWQAIHRAQREGMSAPQAARLVGVDERTVYRHRRKARVQDQNLSLFENENQRR
ncbi:MAG: helix-turn-helix domain-containing protein [Desulfarculales bacterium]|jgi:hypothetical protein|nr:helix-turn-helix domain-containing protein [Desulfarculales bacterium]